MKKTRNASCHLTSSETVGGLCYLLLQLFVLPGLLSWGNSLLQHPLSNAELNFAFYLVNFIAILLILHSFLGRNLHQATQHPAILCQAVILGLAAYYACEQVLSLIVGQFLPGFSNYNDASIAVMASSSYFLMAIGTIILVPPVEECLYRGVIFRNLYGKSHWAAYLCSMAAFSVIHIIGYVGAYTPAQLLIAFLQYLPAGLCLAWAYTKADTIFAPILIHAIINAVSIGLMR